MRTFQSQKWLLTIGLGLALSSVAMPMPLKRALKPARPQSPPSLSLVGQTATLLPNGKLLLVGGKGPREVFSTTSLKDTLTGVTVPLAKGLLFPRAWHTATLLPDGSVLIFGGIGTDGHIVTTAERLDPATGETQVVGTPGLTVRAHHTATLLTDGRVLIAGGLSDSGDVLGTADLWDPRTSSVVSLMTNLLVPVHDQTASLSGGEVLLWGGMDSHAAKINFGEVFDPASLRFRIQTAAPQYQSSNEPATVEATIPTDGSENVNLDSLIAFRFSKALSVVSVNSETLIITGPSGPLAAKVIPAEGGMLAFASPQENLLPGTIYNVTLSGATDSSGTPLSSTSFSFTTAGGTPEGYTGLLGYGGAAGDPLNSPFQKLPPLEAPPGVTAISGQVLLLNGEPLEGVTLGIGSNRIETDRTGRFLLRNISAGHMAMVIDGRTANRKSVNYGVFKAGVDVTGGQTTVLQYTIWMPVIDTANAVTLPVPTAKEIVVTTPRIPGLEFHIPAGTTITDIDGKVSSQVSITPIPTTQPPFPLPPGVNTPIFFTIQPGGGWLWVNNSGGPDGGWLVYPNTFHETPGSQFDFWNYNAGSKGWYIYGHGRVSPDSKSVVPDPGVLIYELTGAMEASSSAGPSSGPNSSCPGYTLLWCSDGEPVDLGTGLFVYEKDDLYLPDIIPIRLKRTYRPNDGASRAFGVGTSHNYDIFLVGDENPYTYQELVLADGSRIHYPRISSGTGWTDAVYQNTTQGGAFFGSTISWNGNGWNLLTIDGTTYKFPEAANATRGQLGALIGITDRNGNNLTITRDANANITQITSPNGRWVQFTADANYRITQAEDNLGRIVQYSYDSGGRLTRVTDVNGGGWQYSFDSSNNMLTLVDPRNITYLTNQYDSSNRVIKQTLADGISTYQFAYNPGCVSNCSVIAETDVTDPNGHIKKAIFNTPTQFANGFTTGGTGSTVTKAAGTTVAQTYSYQYQLGTDLLSSVTDMLNRMTSYNYNSSGQLTSITRLSGTSNAVTTSFTYSGTFNRLSSIIDPLSHTTSFTYDAKGNLISVSDPLSNTTTIQNDAQGKLVSATNSLGQTVTLTYDSADLQSITDALGRRSTFFFDSAGRLLSRVNPLVQRTVYSYNALNQLTRTTDASGAVTSFGYDPNGNLTSVTDANSHLTQYSYDNMDRVHTRTDALNNSETYNYDSTGNLVTFTDRRGKVTSYSYDALNRRTFAGFGTTSGPTYESTISYSYDAGNRLSTVGDSVAGTITPTFDGLDRLTQEQTPQGTVNYTYDAANRRNSMTVAGQAAVNYSYDNSNRLIGMTQGTSTSVSFAYDGANRRTSLTLPNGIVIGYSYDNASELSGLTYTLGTNTLGNLIYSYDLTGRPTSVGGSLAQTELPVSVSITTYNANNQLTAWGTASLFYDADGNMTSDGTNSYTWNARNQLNSMNFNNVSFQYDGYGRRTGKTISGSTTNYVYDSVNVVQELSGSTVTANLLSGGIDEIFMRTDSNGAANFLSDALGSTIALTNSSGSTLASYAYEPFGKTTVTSGSSANPYEYTGRENDGTGIYFYRNRYYSPSLQRFISEDLLGFGGGDANLYGYVGNSPTNSTDWSGMTRDCFTTGCGGVPQNPLAGRKGSNPTPFPTAVGGLGGPRTPARGGPPNGRSWLPDPSDDPNGKRDGTCRLFDCNGNADRDIDYGHDHNGVGDPHVHDWDWSNADPRGPGRAPLPGEIPDQPFKFIPVDPIFPGLPLGLGPIPILEPAF